LQCRSHRARLVALFLMAFSMCGNPVHAAVPSTMSYQGLLSDGGGVPVADGTYALTFNLYDAETDGTLLWTETQSIVQVTGGLFAVVLGSVTPLDVPFDQQYWLGVVVEADPEMVPRTPLTSAPYALATRTPSPGVAQALFAGGYEVLGNANFQPETMVTDLHLNFDAPADGFVVVHAAGYVATTLVPAGNPQYVLMQISETTDLVGIVVNPQWGYYHWVGFQFAPNNGYFDWPFSIQRTFPVTAGAHRYSFCSARYGSFFPQTYVNNLSMIATYYPVSYGAVVTAPAAAREGGQPSAATAHGPQGSSVDSAIPAPEPSPR
jgi:hypothetical protein